jgi:predicted nucleic acid-binding protein
MKKIVVIDTSVLVGLLDNRDHWHKVAKEVCEALIEVGMEVVYFDCVLTEAISVLARRTAEQKRPEQFDNLLNQLVSLIPNHDILWVSAETQRLYQPVVELIRHTRGELNFNDALIALICREQSISLLASFDRDFDQLNWLTRISNVTQLTK